MLYAYTQKDFNGRYEGMRTSLKSVEFFGYKAKLLWHNNNRRGSKAITGREPLQGHRPTVHSQDCASVYSRMPGNQQMLLPSLSQCKLPRPTRKESTHKFLLYPLKTKINLNYIQIFNSYRAVNTLCLGCKNQSANAV